MLVFVPETMQTLPGAISFLGGALPLLASLVVMLNMPMRNPLLDSSGISIPFTVPTSDLRSPEDIITLWQWMSVSWMAPLIKIGYQRQLNETDVWFFSREFQHSRLHERFRALSGTVFVRILKANGLDLVIITGLGVLEVSAELTEPLLLKQLLGALMSEPQNLKIAFTYAILILLARLYRAQSGIFSMWFQRRNYERCRGEMITMIYEKTLRRKAFTFPSGTTKKAKAAGEDAPPSPSDVVSTSSTLAGTESDAPDDPAGNKQPRARFKWFSSCFSSCFYPDRSSDGTEEEGEEDDPESPSSTGKILNLMRSDVYEVAQRFWEVAWITTKPLSLVISIVLIWRLMGRSSLYGVGILVLGVIINRRVMRYYVAVEKKRRAVTDEKLQRTSQFIESIRHLRWYDWQAAWLDQIMEARRAELRKRVYGNVALKVFNFVNTLTGYIFPIAAFFAYTTISGNPLTVDIAFPALDLFTVLQNNLREIPDLAVTLMNASIAMGRIERFMLEPDRQDLDEDDVAGNAPQGELEIKVDNATFSWPGTTKKVLQNISLVCKPGLNLICGRVGAGKTALLHAILGELDQDGGDRHVPPEMVGYCAQTPWLESMSIRENILFCTPYDKTRFDAVIEACCLKADLEKFRAQDLAMIGENGVGLSGGQRARVSLARAIYSRARILLLDDPIAALDHDTASSVLRNLFADRNSSLTAGRLVVLVTHRMDIATRYATQIIKVGEHGHVKTLDKSELASNEEELEELAVVTSSNKRPGSSSSSSTAGETATPEKFMEDEHRAHGGVQASVYWTFIKAGTLSWWAAMIVSFMLFRVARVVYLWFLKSWGEQYTKHPVPLDTTSMYHQQVFMVPPAIGEVHADNGSWADLSPYLPDPTDDVHPWLRWFGIISMVLVATQALSDFAMVYIAYRAGKNLFEKALHRVSGATFRYYDVTPVGRLMNRLTSDMGVIDGSIAGKMMEVAWYGMGWLSAIVVIASATKLFLVLSVAMTVMFFLIFARFLPTSQSLRRLETVSLSPLMSNFGALVEGLTTVRAYRASAHFQRRIILTTDAFQRMDHIYWCLQAWLQFRFDMLSALTTFTLTVLAVHKGFTGGAVGFVLAAASNFVQSTHSLCRKYGELQMEFVSVERVVELLGLGQEPQGDHEPPAAWPRYGDDIVFDNVTLRYAPDLDPVLLDLNLVIPGGANVAVTGRTGSGKSTMALTLLGTLHPDAESGGKVLIGNVDLADVDKHALRRNITFVAQDPVLFPGTLRKNLDPLNEHADAECADVLDRVLGGGSSESGSWIGSGFTLDSPVNSGGKNLSQGQRQLVGLGRAILRRSPVVVLDEATASIDAETAAYIQRLLREELKHSTVITIAHRKEAVKDADFEIVLDQGRVVRSGPLVPASLL